MQVPKLYEFKPISGLVLVLSLSVIYYVGSVIYYLFLHPLAKYPGPFWAKFSVWPSYYHSFRGDRHIWIWQCHQIYGPVFRYRPDGILFNSIKANRDIYEGNANAKKGSFYGAFPEKAGVNNTWNCIDKVKHARKRRILNAAFSDRALRDSEQYIIQHADRWCELLLDRGDDEWSSPRNIADWSDVLVFDILGELCFARSFDLKEPGDNHLKSLPTFMVDWTSLMYNIGQSPFLRAWLWLKPRGMDKLFEIAAPKNVRAFQKFTRDCLLKRLDEEKRIQEKDLGVGDTRKDMFHYLFRAKNPETGGLGYTRDELFQETILLVIAGADTTSTVFAAMLFYLTRNPRVYEKLSGAVRNTFKSAEDIRAGPQLNSCRYLRAFINEALRMNPPASADLNREALAGGMTIDGHFVKEGTNIGVALFSLQHNEDYFPDAFVFRPERWIPDEKTGVTGESVAACESAFAPFSIGSRACPGKSLAYLEMSIVMAKVIYLFEVKAVEGDNLGAGRADLIWGRRNKANFQTQDIFVSKREGPMVQFSSRRA